MQQVHLMVLGNTLTIKTYLYAVFIDIYSVHLYFYVRIVLHELGISLPHEDCFNKVKSSCIKSEYYSVCDDYGVNADKTWMHGE